MKKLYLISLIFILTLTTGCVKNKFKIEFSLSSDVNNAYTLVYYASAKDGGRLMQTVAAPAMGKCEVEGITRYPTLVCLYAGNMQRPAAFIYAERGDNIKVTGESDNPLEWTIGGNDVNKDWSKWRRENKDILSANDSQKINDAVSGYVKGNPGSPVSSFLLLTSFDRSIDEAKYSELWRSLEKSAKREEIAGIVARSDQFLPEVSQRDNVDAIPFTLRGDSLDTLRIKGSKAAILYFWHSDDSERRVVIDSLKQLTKEFPDSTRRTIADFSLNPDSTDWVLTVRYDSIRTTRRGWIFRGEADETLVRLGVAGTPWIIVTDAKGKQKYYGADIKKGSEVFRQLMKGNNK